MHTLLVSITACTLLLAACGDSSRPTSSPGGNPLPGGGKCASALPIQGQTEFVATIGRKLSPMGRLTTLGNFPSGGALTPDGQYYWAVNSGHGKNSVSVVEVSSGRLVKTLPLPGGFGGIAINASGSRAYVSGTRLTATEPDGPTKGDEGDVIHVFEIKPKAEIVELEPIRLPVTQLGSGRLNSLPPNPTAPNLPAELAVSPDGSRVVVALNNADRVALIDTASAAVSTLRVGSYPQGVAVERSGRFAFVTSQFDGTVTRIDLGSGAVSGSALGVGGPDGNQNSHPQHLLADPRRDRLYVAVTNHDGVAVVNTANFTLEQFISLKRPEGYGVAPVALALHPDGKTLYVATAGEDAVVAIALEPRGTLRAYDIIGKLPTSFYPTDVEVTPDGCNLVWTSAKAVNAGPNSAPGQNPSYLPQMLIGKTGMLGLPDDSQFAVMTSLVDQAVRPDNRRPPPADTPVHGACSADGVCAASDKIKYVFYLVRENRTYDQIFGCDPRGDGECSIEMFGDNDKGGPTSGVTPNAHKISREWLLLDRFFQNSEVSIDGHIITAGIYATDRTIKTLHNNYSDRGAPFEHGLYPVSFPPKAFLFDQAAKQGLSFRIYGERSGGTLPVLSADGRPTYLTVQANSDLAYPSNIQSGCLAANLPGAPGIPACTFDSGMGANAPGSISRIDIFNADFAARVATCNAQTIGTAACLVPRFNYLISMNDHTNGTRSGDLTPKAMVADNDLHLGQLLQILSNSAIWPQTVLFVVEDDSQAGTDHVDGHRSASYVAGPYVKRGGAVVNTRYDQYSVVRTLSLILGLQPLSLYDAMATPMYDVFTATPNLAPYTAVLPQQNIRELNPATAANAALSNLLPWNVPDTVPQPVADRILWQSIHGANSEPPAPGPNSSPAELARAQAMWKVWKAGGDVKKHLFSTADAD